MKRFLLLLTLQILGAQTTHSIVFSWTDTLNPAGTTYNVYQQVGICPASLAGFSKIATALTTKTFTQTNVAQGTYCTYVTAAGGGQESSPSNTNQSVVGPFSPTGLSSVIN